MDMKKWLEDLKNAKEKKAMPILSFPAVELMGITVEELISKRLSLPIGQINFPENISIITFPANADIDVMIPMSQFLQTDNSKFKLNVDYKQYRSNNKKLPLVLTKIPDYIERITIIPDSVEYIIERKEIVSVPNDSILN